MKVIVVGPQHSCTRLIVGIINRHQDIELVDHLGSIDENSYNEVFKTIEQYDKIIIVSRDNSCVNKSNEINKDINFNDGICEKTVDLINRKINDLIYNKNYDFNNIIFVSIESLVQYKNLIIKKYDFNLSGNYRPKEINGGERWFSVNLNIEDPNKKYII